MRAQYLPDVDVSFLDRLLIENGFLRPVSADTLEGLNRQHFQKWLWERGIYQYPTRELIDWLHTFIAGRAAIEICAGYSCLGRYLGIPMTDSFLHSEPEVRFWYRAQGQPTTDPPADVLKMTANEAVEHFAPEVVIGAWVTPHEVNGYGPDEIEIVKRANYVCLGNLQVNPEKPILGEPHEEHYFPWLYSRSIEPLLDRIFVWAIRTDG